MGWNARTTRKCFDLNTLDRWEIQWDELQLTFSRRDIYSAYSNACTAIHLYLLTLIHFISVFFIAPTIKLWPFTGEHTAIKHIHTHSHTVWNIYGRRHLSTQQIKWWASDVYSGKQSCSIHKLKIMTKIDVKNDVKFIVSSSFYSYNQHMHTHTHIHIRTCWGNANGFSSMAVVVVVMPPCHRISHGKWQ